MLYYFTQSGYFTDSDRLIIHCFFLIRKNENTVLFCYFYSLTLRFSLANPTEIFWGNLIFYAMLNNLSAVLTTVLCKSLGTP
uniref:Uncharacterized protein n=1 Tax=Monopterus albus TaxID=43700 RepID=A0A3Q3K0S0_MONAL